MDPLTILTAFIPTISEAIRAGVNKLTGNAGAQPANVQEAVQIMQAETERFKAINGADGVSGPVSLWVNNIRALQRPAVALLVILAWATTLYMEVSPDLSTMAANLASSVAFYLFGDRTLMYARKAG